MSNKSRLSKRPKPKPISENACRYCGTELVAKARLCPGCDRWQFPFGWLASQLSLGDVALYGSLVVVVWSTFNIVLFGKEAEFDTILLSCSNHVAEVYVANTGTSRGILVSGTVRPKTRTNNGTTVDAAVAPSESARGRPVIEPASGDIVRLEVPISARGSFDSQTGGAECSVALEFDAIYRSDGKMKPISIPEACSCSDFQQF